jgi:predicted membrane-bound mannosyltransferase
MPGSLGSQPAYIFLTGSTFAVFGSSDFTARLWPALLGGCLVLLPFFFRRPLGRLAALVCAFGLALDPGLVAVSRQAGGPMLAVSFLLLALGLAYARLHPGGRLRRPACSDRQHPGHLLALWQNCRAGRGKSRRETLAS